MTDYVFYTYFAEDREYFVYGEEPKTKKKDFPFLESLLRLVYLDIWSLEIEFKKVDKALLEFCQKPSLELQDEVMAILENWQASTFTLNFCAWTGRNASAIQSNILMGISRIDSLIRN